MDIVLADSNDLTRIGLNAIFSSNSSIKNIAEATSSNQLLELFKQKNADIVIIDYTSYGFNIDVIPKIIQQSPHTKFLAITPEQSAPTLVNALKSGVTSYIKKDCDVQEIKDALSNTSQGKKFFCGKILETIRNAEINVEDISNEEFTCEPVFISERENEIITMIAEGLTNIEIAKQLFLSNHTVNTHRKNIMSKLGVKNTAGIVMFAVKTNLVSPNKFLFSGD